MRRDDPNIFGRVMLSTLKAFLQSFVDLPSKPTYLIKIEVQFFSLKAEKLLPLLILKLFLADAAIGVGGIEDGGGESLEGT